MDELSKLNTSIKVSDLKTTLKLPIDKNILNYGIIGCNNEKIELESITNFVNSLKLPRGKPFITKTPPYLFASSR